MRPPSFARRQSSPGTPNRISVSVPNRVTLDQVLSRLGPGSRLTVSAALYVAWQVCRAVALLHARGQVHGALSPAHILLAADGRVTLQSARDVSGTPSGFFGAIPRGTKAPAIETDLRAVAGILFELLTGLTEAEALAQVSEKNMPRFPAPSLFNRDVDSATDEVVTKLLGHGPFDRSASALALVGDLARCYRLHSGTSVSALPPQGSGTTALSAIRPITWSPTPAKASRRARGRADAARPAPDSQTPVVLGVLLDTPTLRRKGMTSALAATELRTEYLPTTPVPI